MQLKQSSRETSDKKEVFKMICNSIKVSNFNSTYTRNSMILIKRNCTNYIFNINILIYIRIYFYVIISI